MNQRLDAVLIDGSVAGAIVIGGTAVGEGNVIAGNTGRGIAMAASTTTTLKPASARCKAEDNPV